MLLIVLKRPSYCRVLKIDVDLRPFSGHLTIHLDYDFGISHAFLGVNSVPWNMSRESKTLKTCLRAHDKVLKGGHGLRKYVREALPAEIIDRSGK